MKDTKGDTKLNENHKTTTHQTNKSSNRSEPKVLKQCEIVKGCSEAAAYAKKNQEVTSIHKPTNQQTLKQRELAKQIPNSRTQ